MVGVIMGATDLDGNNGLFPIAIIAPSLKRHHKPLTFISDKQKGVEDGVRKQFGYVNHFHRLCYRHHYKNMKMKHPGSEIGKLAWRAAKAYNEIDYSKAMKELGETKIQAREWLEKQDLSQWTRWKFDKTSKCEHVSNNFLCPGIPICEFVQVTQF